MSNPLDVLHLDQFLSHMKDHGLSVKAAHENSRDQVIQELKSGSFCRWRERTFGNQLGQDVSPPYPVEVWLHTFQSEAAE
jgi:hypothetical protein